MNDIVHDSDGVRVVGVTCTPKKDSTAASAPAAVSYSAPLTVIADGCFSKFRKQFIEKPVETTSHFVGYGSSLASYRKLIASLTRTNTGTISHFADN